MTKVLATLTGIMALVALNACSSTTPDAGAPGSSPPSASSAATFVAPSATSGTSAHDTSVTVTAGDHTIYATIGDGQVCQDFLATLPTTSDRDWDAGMDHITGLPAPVAETGPFSTEVGAGNIVYDNPMDSITIT